MSKKDEKYKRQYEEVEEYRALLEAPSRFEDGFTIRTIIGVLFISLIMTPGEMYLGLVTGGGIGLYQDKQEARLRQELQNTGVSVTRNGDLIILNMPSNVTFNSDQAAVKPEFYRVLNSVALVLKEYNRTIVNVYGHTDSDGSDSYNQQLSERRAVSVAQYLVQQGTDSRRYHVVGFGETSPIASNATASGKAANRRVEIQIAPITQ